MSVHVMSAVWHHSRSTGVARLVLLAMADEAHESGDLIAYKRSVSHFATKCRTTKTSVKRSIDKLIELGELKVLAVGSGREQSNYRIRLPGLVHPDETPIEGAQNVPPGDTESTPLGAQDVPPGGTPEAPPSSRSPRSAPSLPGIGSPPPAPTPDDDVNATAKCIARAVWDAKDPKPVMPYIAVEKIARQFIKAGHTPDAITTAMIAVPTISTRWVEAEIAKTKPKPRPRAGSSSRTAPAGRIEDL